jgi:hypothetical protein
LRQRSLLLLQVVNDPVRERHAADAGLLAVAVELAGDVVGDVQLAAGAALGDLVALRECRLDPMTPDSSTAPGLAMFLPVYFGAVPCVASNIAAWSPMFAPAARPMPPVIAAAASEM